MPCLQLPTIQQKYSVKIIYFHVNAHLFAERLNASKLVLMSSDRSEVLAPALCPLSEVALQNNLLTGAKLNMFCNPINNYILAVEISGREFICIYFCIRILCILYLYLYICGRGLWQRSYICSGKARSLASLSEQATPSHTSIDC